MYHQLTTPSFALINQTSTSSQINALCGKRSRLQLLFCNEEGNSLNTHHCQKEGVTETKQFVCEGYRCILCYKPGNEQNIYLVEYLFQTSTVSTLLNNFSLTDEFEYRSQLYEIQTIGKVHYRNEFLKVPWHQSSMKYYSF